jgi:hypothetical protein
MPPDNLLEANLLINLLHNIILEKAVKAYCAGLLH